MRILIFSILIYSVGCGVNNKVSTLYVPLPADTTYIEIIDTLSEIDTFYIRDTLNNIDTIRISEIKFHNRYINKIIHDNKFRVKHIADSLRYIEDKIKYETKILSYKKRIEDSNHKLYNTRKNNLILILLMLLLLCYIFRSKISFKWLYKQP